MTITTILNLQKIETHICYINEKIEYFKIERSNNEDILDIICETFIIHISFRHFNQIEELKHVSQMKDIINFWKNIFDNKINEIEWNIYKNVEKKYVIINNKCFIFNNIEDLYINIETKECYGYDENDENNENDESNEIYHTEYIQKK